MGNYGFRDDKLVVAELEANKITCGDASYVTQYVIPKLSTVATGSIISGWDVSAGTAAKTNEDFVTRLPYPVNVAVSANVAGTAGGEDALTFAGFDARGNAITESIAVQSTTAGINYGDKAFSRVTSITPNSAAHKSTSVGIHFGDKLGLIDNLAGTADILVWNYNGAAATTSPQDLTFSLANQTVTVPVSATGASLSIVYKTGLQ